MSKSSTALTCERRCNAPASLVRLPTHVRWRLVRLALPVVSCSSGHVGLCPSGSPGFSCTNRPGKWSLCTLLSTFSVGHASQFWETAPSSAAYSKARSRELKAQMVLELSAVSLGNLVCGDNCHVSLPTSSMLKPPLHHITPAGIRIVDFVQWSTQLKLKCDWLTSSG